MNQNASPVHIAVVGIGYWGPNLVRNFSNLPEVKIESVCDLDSRRLSNLASKYPDIKMTTHLEEILDNPKIEAVVVATPAETHRTIVERALRAKKHVYVEKPLAVCASDAEFLVRLAEEFNRVLMVGHIFLYAPPVSQMIHLVQQGAIGKIRYVHGIRTSMSGTARVDTNILWDALIHDAYILPALFGRLPFRVLAVGGSYLNPGLEDVAFLTFDFGNGALAHIYVSWYALEKTRRLTVIGSEAILEYNDLAPSKLVRYLRWYEQDAVKDPQGRPKWYWRDEGSEVIEISQEEPLQIECQHFIHCITNGTSPLTDGRAGLKAVQILEACEHSLRSGNVWVEIQNNKMDLF